MCVSFNTLKNITKYVNDVIKRSQEIKENKYIEVVYGCWNNNANKKIILKKIRVKGEIMIT